MSYTALARKWRPKKFAELVGQEHVRRALVNALASGRVHHAFLFTGTRGVGKTTIARILAKCLNCERGVTAEPCGVCAQLPRDRRRALPRSDRGRCGLAHQGGRYARAARQRAVRPGARALQGVPHRRGAHALDAFLQRAAEDARGAAAAREVPARDHRPAEAAGDGAVALPAVQPEAPAGRRRSPRTCATSSTAEGVAFEPAALALLAQAADGSVRDALSLLDQLIAFGGGRAGGGRGARHARHDLARSRGAARRSCWRAATARRCCAARRRWRNSRPTTRRCSMSSRRCWCASACGRRCRGYEGDELYAPELLERLAAHSLPRTCSCSTRPRSSAGAICRSRPSRAVASR